MKAVVAELLTTERELLGKVRVKGLIFSINNVLKGSSRNRKTEKHTNITKYYEIKQITI
jgi:hypothetical protein